MDLLDFENGSLYLFTSLTAGSSHIISATSRLETILKANRIPFQAIDVATDDKARKLWARRAQKKKLPGLVKDGYVIGDLEEIEEWNEFGELKENIGDVSAPAKAPREGINIRPPGPSSPPRQHDDSVPFPNPSPNETTSALLDSSSRIALPGAAEIAARNKAKAANATGLSPPAVAAPPLPDKASPVAAVKEEAKENEPSDHLSAPASAIHSTATSPPVAPVSAPSEIPTDATPAETHAGSEVKEAPLEEVQKIESENALPEDPSEDAVDATTKTLESVTFEEPEKPQEKVDEATVATEVHEANEVTAAAQVTKD